MVVVFILKLAANRVYAEIYETTFINNSSPIGGQSIMIPFQGSLSGLHVSNCTFKEHRSSSIICYNFWRGKKNYTSEYDISDCIFEANVFEVKGRGVLDANSTLGVVYRRCQFIDNVCSGPGVGLISSNNKADTSPSCRFIDCEFVGCECREDSSLLFNVDGCNVSLLSVENCSFDGCSGAHLGLTPHVSSVLLSESHFTSALGWLAIHCGELRLRACGFSLCTGRTEFYPLELEVSGQAVIEDTAFDVPSAATLPGQLALRVRDEANIQFFNCCFTKSQEFADTSRPLYLSLSGAGTVTFQYVCFDAESQEAAMSVQGPQVKLIESSFGDCECWELAGSETPSGETVVISDSETDPALSSSETLPTDYSETSAETGELDPESGGGGAANAGLIAGVVVAIIVLVVVIVVVILLLLRRRRQTSGGGDHPEEFTEETITTLTANEDTNEGEVWSQGTQDNPLFASENFDNDDDDDDFANAFEEQFFTDH